MPRLERLQFSLDLKRATYSAGRIFECGEHAVTGEFFNPSSALLDNARFQKRVVVADDLASSLLAQLVDQNRRSLDIGEHNHRQTASLVSRRACCCSCFGDFFHDAFPFPYFLGLSGIREP